jgi:starch synthase
MDVVLSVSGKFHTFDLARELHARQALNSVFTGYPRFKLKGEGLPADKIRSFPWLITPYMAFTRRERLGDWAVKQWELANHMTLDAYTANALPECDVFVGLSASGLKSGQRARQQGIAYVCDRGSTHIRHQDEVLAEEHAIWQQPYSHTDPRIIAREEAEYDTASCITVPSGYTRQTFIDLGIAADKVRVLPYGVNLGHFQQVASPDTETFEVLFAGGASLRKGVPYLLQAFQRLSHPRKRLSFAGAMSPEFISVLQSLGLWSDKHQVLGHLSREALRERMSRSHVLVLPSVEEGLALVQAQALACGCPVIATEATGAPDLFTDGEAGFILPTRRADLIADKLQMLADMPALRQQLSQGALHTVSRIGGWNSYGDKAMQIYQSLVSAS